MMGSILIHPLYFGSIAQFVAIAKADEIVFENEDNYQKQTFRNRTTIYGANGKLVLTIPVKHTGVTDGRQRYKDVRIENDFKWQDLHWKSIESAYRTSPFFEFYENELAPLFNQKKEFLLDFNYECMEVVSECLQMDISYSKTTSYEKKLEIIKDCRYLAIAKKQKAFDFQPYNQVFVEKHGYIDNLSILDLLFNEGTNALSYLENQKLS